MSDVIDNILSTVVSPTIIALRQQRLKAYTATQASYEAMFQQNDTLPAHEKFLVAWVVANACQCPYTSAHYAKALVDLGVPTFASVDAISTTTDPRTQELIQFSETLAISPKKGDRSRIDRLLDIGFTPAQIVLIAQIIGYVSYQIRVTTGVRSLQESNSADASLTGTATENFIHPALLPNTDSTFTIEGFTNAPLGWKSWLPPLDVHTASAHQLAVLDASHPQARSSDYYLTLAWEPTILEHRSAAYNAIMYAPGGLARAQRELASTTVARINGCTYCASVHAIRFEQLSKRNDVIQQIFQNPHHAGTSTQEQAIIQAAIVLTQAPATLLDTSQLARCGLSNLEILDTIHSIAIFAWATRLMQNLGEATPLS